MGNYLMRLRERARPNRGLKRSLQDLESDQDSESDFNKELNTPKRKKLMSTSQYIYKTLFLEGKNSDVTIVALNVEWRLHKVYLCQAPYFSSMFSGSWKEANDDEIHIEIADPNITVDALKIVLGSLYQDEVTIQPAEVIPILGAAILFQLDPLIQQCCDIMKESINVRTVILYIDTATQYGLQLTHHECFNWLLRNLLSHIPEYPKTLRAINLKLMIELVSSPDLFVIQTEFSVYIILKMWVFLRENPDWDGKYADCVSESHKYFHNIAENFQGAYLNTEKGQQYKDSFKALRLHHLVHHHIDVEMLDMDTIIPTEWMYPIYKSQWHNMLRVDQAVDKGPKEISEEEFNASCFRCGRVLPADRKVYGLCTCLTNKLFNWPFEFEAHVAVDWVQFWFGFSPDLRSSLFKCERNDRTSVGDYQNATNQHSRRSLTYRFTIASINEQRQVTYTSSTGLQNVTLAKNEEIRIMILSEEVTFPIVLSANFVLISPLPTP